MKCKSFFCFLILTFFLVSGIAFPVLAVTNTDIIITHFDTDPDEIKEGDKFDFNVWLENKSGSALTNVFLVIDDSSSFYASTGMSQIPVPDWSANKSHVSASLVYKGTGNELKLVIKYTKDGAEDEKIQSIYLNTKEKDSSPRGTPTDTSKYVPRISVSGDMKIPILTAGKTESLVLPLNNYSTHGAKDITVSLQFPEKDNEFFIMDTVKMSQDIERIPANREENAEFRLNIRQDIPKGLYTVKINYAFSNLYNDKFTSSDTIYINVENDKTPPEVFVAKIESTPALITPGEKLDMNVSFSNIGKLDAKNVKVKILGLDAKGLQLFNAGDSVFIGNIPGYGTKVILYSLTTSPYIQGSSYPIGFVIEYEDEVGNSYSKEYNSFLPVKTSGEEEAVLKVKNVKLSSSAVRAGDEFGLKFSITNEGKGRAQNIKAWLEGKEGLITKSISPVRIQELGPQNTASVDFTMLTDESLSKTQPVAIRIEYEISRMGQSLKQDITQYFEVEVLDREGAAEKTVPRIIVNRYTFQPETINAGKAFTLDLSFLNTNKEKSVENIKISLSSKDGIFTPENSSNTFYIEAITPGQSADRSIVLYPKADAAPKSYPLDLLMVYEDSDGEQYEEAESLNIPVKQEQRLETSDLSLPPQAFAGQGIPVYVDFFNMGKSTLYNLMVKAEGDFGGENNSYFAGNVEPGRSDYYEGMIVPQNPGKLDGKIVFSYEDEAGNEHKVEKEFTLNVSDMQQQNMDPGQMERNMQGMMPPEMEQKSGPGILVIIGIALAVAAVAVVIIILVRKKRYSKKGMTLDE